jgi:hypothetical protein
MSWQPPGHDASGWQPDGWQPEAATVEVPDVVGETQATGTTTLEAALFVVAVTTSYSASVAVGIIISQSPAGGSFAAEGATVTITVSLGPRPNDESPTGGWLFLNLYEGELQRRKALERERKHLEEETEQIEDDLDRNIAQLLREQEAIDEKRDNLKRLAEIAKQNANLEAARQYSERVAAAYVKAITEANASNLKALANLDKELQLAREEEEFLIMALLMLAE